MIFLIKAFANSAKFPVAAQILRGGRTMPKDRLFRDISQIVSERGPINKGKNAGDAIIKGGGFKRAFKSATENKTTPGRQMRRLMNKELGKGAWRTLGWKYFKEQMWYAWNQSKGLHGTMNLAQVNNTSANTRKSQETILRRLIMSKQQRPDSASLSSSVVIFGRWTPNLGQGQYWVGTLDLTYSPLKNCHSSERYPPKNYTHQNVSLATWSMMKNAMGSCGTGAYSVFKRTYLQGGIGMIPAYGYSEQVTRPMRN